MQAQLWMGSLEPNMTEPFLMAAFHRMGTRPSNIRVMRNKHTHEPAGYAFISFQADSEARDALHLLNGKPIPGTFPVVRFRLNTASKDSRSVVGTTDREFSVWVGDLSADVDDYSLYRLFSTKYGTVKTAKVIVDNTGVTKGYGFVCFNSEDDQKHALYALNGYVGLGSKPLKICSAVPKPKGQAQNQMTYQGHNYNNGMEYNQYYDPNTYWQNYPTWNNYNGSEQQAVVTEAVAPRINEAQQLVEHKVPLDVDAMNADFLDEELSLWDAVERSHWFPPELMEVT